MGTDSGARKRGQVLNVDEPMPAVQQSRHILLDIMQQSRHVHWTFARNLQLKFESKGKIGMPLGILCSLLGHKWGDWFYEAEDSCLQARRCLRDGVTEKRGPVHTWGEWKYMAEGSCEQARLCTRDGAMERRGPVHAWGKWEYEAEGRCEQSRKCHRDGAIQQRIEHNWDGGISLCVRCKSPKPCSHPNLVSNGYSQGGQDWTENRCPDCGSEWTEP